MKVRYAKIEADDVVNSMTGVNVSLFLQGCDRHCPQCFNPETWDHNGGTEIEGDALISEIISLANTNGVERGLSILGGEPLSEQNMYFTVQLVKKFRETFPERKIYLWTGFTIQELSERAQADGSKIQQYLLLGIKSKAENYPYLFFMDIVTNVDYIIDGPFIQEQKDLSLKLRGSANQHIYSFNKENMTFNILDDEDKQ